MLGCEDIQDELREILFGVFRGHPYGQRKNQDTGFALLLLHFGTCTTKRRTIHVPRRQAAVTTPSASIGSVLAGFSIVGKGKKPALANRANNCPSIRRPPSYSPSPYRTSTH